MELPHLELWLKRYEVFSARDPSVMKNFKIWAGTEKQKAQSAKYAFTKLKTNSGLKKNGNTLSLKENVLTRKYAF